MSHQHLYSRVPARVSLFNKRDGFDTFALSAGLDPRFVLGELSCMYADKLSIHDPARIRRGEIPVIYSQAPLPGGVIAQTAISYIPTDFTGERSSYFAHTLILNEGERASVLNNAAADCFNKKAFFTDISRFNITSPVAGPNPACGELGYIPAPLSDHKATVAKYAPEMVKSFIYSLLCTTCQPSKDLLFRLPVNDSAASDEALALISAVMSLLPYGLRERLSFVTLVNRAKAYPGFKVKCIGSEFSEMDEKSAVLYDFAAGRIIGSVDGYEKNAQLASFLYSLFEYKKIRDAFLPFVWGITEKYQLDLNVNTLREIVFLFWQCSGFYVESSIVADDEAVCNLMDVYGKYRDGLREEHRVRAYRPLARYADRHIAIPDGVLARLSTLYPDECPAARAVALDVMLKLIHVDLMRDTLFCFISRYYDSEIDGVKAVICANLASVFYGGFLQSQILAFFDAHFRGESTETRDIILDKMLLSVRTPEIQRQILVMLDRHYASLTPEQKMRVCSTCLEMLPECDTLSALCVSLINRRVGKENNEISAFMYERLSDLLAYCLSHGDGRLMTIFVENPGFCEEVAIRLVLSRGIGAEILVSLLAAMPAHKRCDKIVRAYKMLGDIPVRAYIDLLLRFTALPVVVAPSGLKELLRADRIASLTLPADITPVLRERIIYPVIPYVFADAFKEEYGESGLTDLEKYAESNPVLKSLPQYALITTYHELISKCAIGDTESAFKLAERLPESAEIRANIGEYIKAYAYDPDGDDDQAVCTYRLVINYLTGGKLGFDRLYSRYQRRFEDSFEEEGIAGSAIAKGLNADRRGAASAMELILACADGICDASDKLCAVAVAPESGLRRAISDFITIYGFGAGIFLKNRTKDFCTEIEDMVAELIDERNASITSVGDAVDLLLRRKN